MPDRSFDKLGLIEPILQALRTEGYTTPTPIQAQSIPYLLEGRDLLGCAQTGTGKTAAFAIPLIQRLVSAAPAASGQRRPIRALILTPTRELAIQIDESFRAYGRHTNLKYTVIFGGVGQKPQTDALRAGVDVLIATPGRLLDLMNQRYVDLKSIEYFVLDEADRMLDMGFIHDVRKVIAVIPPKRQTLFFSATMPPEIQRLSSSILTNPVKVEVTPVSSTAETVQQQVYFVDKANKGALLTHLIKSLDIQQALVFTRTKHGADKLCKVLEKAGIRAEAIHGNKAQNARQRALSNFKERKIRALVATDIAARGIDIDLLGHVVNYEIPNVPETYVHRIGRTGRAGASGLAISLCDQEETEFLRDIQKLIKRDVPVVEEHPFPMVGGTPVVDPGRRQQRGQRPQQQRQEHGHRGGRPQGERNSQRAPQGDRGAQRGPAPSRAEQPRTADRPATSGGVDFAALTAELMRDADQAFGGTPESTSSSRGPGHANGQRPPGGGGGSRRRFRGPRR
ncbi:MAG: DEAD/DEAH box helicase [Flavobacteriales bacterium]|nr:DEAD/DEAH box helicase [Flavobacteriales bacterium]